MKAVRRTSFDVGFARSGALFYAWDEDEKTLVVWASELAAAEPPDRARNGPETKRGSRAEQTRPVAIET